LEQLQDVARAQGTSLWQAACAGALKGKAATSIAAFIRLIESAREVTKSLPLPEAVTHAIEVSGLLALSAGKGWRRARREPRGAGQRRPELRARGGCCRRRTDSYGRHARSGDVAR